MGAITDLGCTDAAAATTGIPNVAFGPNGLGEAVRDENAETGVLRWGTRPSGVIGCSSIIVGAVGWAPKWLDSHSVALGFRGMGDTVSMTTSSSISSSSTKYRSGVWF